MLSLASPRWNELEHAFGRGGDIPEMLRSLEARRQDASPDLWNAICHQYSVYSATIAAVPHVVETIAAFPADEQLDDLVFVGLVAANAPRDLLNSLDADIRAWYEIAIKRAAKLAVGIVAAREYSTDEFAYLLQAIAALHGSERLGRTLSGFANKEFFLVCPHCKSDIYLWPTEDGMTTAAEDPVTHKDTLRLKVRPRQDASMETTGKLDYSSEDDFDWLSQLSREASQDWVTDQLRFLFGSASCPKCSETFSVVDNLA